MSAGRLINSGRMVNRQPGDPLVFHKLAQYHACKLHLKGMRHSSGRSIIAHVKRIYGYKGNNESVVEQFRQALIREGILPRDHKP
jgi:hypothetical protein